MADTKTKPESKTNKANNQAESKNNNKANDCVR